MTCASAVTAAGAPAARELDGQPGVEEAVRTDERAQRDGTRRPRATLLPRPSTDALDAALATIAEAERCGRPGDGNGSLRDAPGEGGSSSASARVA
jgi:hypothetical protein